MDYLSRKRSFATPFAENGIIGEKYPPFPWIFVERRSQSVRAIPARKPQIPKSAVPTRRNIRINFIA